MTTSNASCAEGVALITGGGSGIGRATAEISAREGARVAVADVNLPGAEETAATITAAGGDAVALEVDVTDDAQIQALIGAAVGAFG